MREHDGFNGEEGFNYFAQNTSVSNELDEGKTMKQVKNQIDDIAMKSQ